MICNEFFPSKLVRTYQKSDHEMTMEIHNEHGRLMAIGYCSFLDSLPQIRLVNLHLLYDLYGYELQRWLHVSMSWLRGDKTSVNFESDKTLFEDDYLD